MNEPTHVAPACTFELDLQTQRFTAFHAPEGIFGIDAQRILTDLQDFRRLPLEKYCHAVGLYFSRPDEANRPYQAFSALLDGSPYHYHAHMRNAATRQFSLCEVRVAPSADGRTASGSIIPEK